MQAAKRGGADAAGLAAVARVLGAASVAGVAWLNVTGLMVWLRRLVWIISWLKVIGLSGMAAPLTHRLRSAARRGDASVWLMRLAANGGWRWLRRVLANVCWCGLVLVAGMVWLLV